MSLFVDRSLLKNPLAIILGVAVLVSMLAYYIYGIELAHHLHGIFLGLFLFTLAYTYYRRNQSDEKQDVLSNIAKYFPYLFAGLGAASLWQGVSQLLG